MAVLADASAASHGPFVAGNVEPGARVITDGWVGYNGLAALGYARERRNQKAAARRGEDPGELLPAVHRVSSLCKRWLLGTHQGSVEPAHLQAYLNEFVFRFNRRHSRSRGMVFYRVMELATGHDPVRYDDIRATRKPRSKPPGQRGTGHPPSLERPAAARPWRTAEMQLQFHSADRIPRSSLSSMGQAQVVQICLPEQASAKEPEHAPISGSMCVATGWLTTLCD